MWQVKIIWFKILFSICKVTLLRLIVEGWGWGWIGGSICKFLGKSSIHLVVIREWPKVTPPPLQEILIISTVVHFIRPCPNPTPPHHLSPTLQLCTKDSQENASLKMRNVLKIAKCGQMSKSKQKCFRGIFRAAIRQYVQQPR